nr:MAG TPA: TRYPTOPHAN RNA-BINDING ATTENUATOR PROTEIN-INHIBITORY PROTEIN REGULATION, ANTI-TRAP [Caudoviricetes sp.]
MKKEITRGVRVTVCKECGGSGAETDDGQKRRCRQCQGSGRVTVSSVTVLDIRPYHPRETNEIEE